MACLATCLVLCWLLVPAVIVQQSLRGSAPLGSGENDQFIGLVQPVPLLREPQMHSVYSHLQGAGPAYQLSKRQQKLLRLKQPAASQQQGARAHNSAHSAGHTQNQQEGQQQQQQQKVGPVDVVYLWVNGSDPQLLQELQDLERSSTHSSTTANSSSRKKGPQNDAVRQARFDAGRDELRYSIRSLEMYLPWYRHLYIVTNGQVGTGSTVGWARLACVGNGHAQHITVQQCSLAPKTCISSSLLRHHFKLYSVEKPQLSRVPFLLGLHSTTFSLALPFSKTLYYTLL